MNTLSKLLLSAIVTLNTANATQLTATIHPTNDGQTTIGTVVFSETPYGLMITPNLSKLSPGLHGFHLHQHPNCAHEGMEAGAHFDPQNTNSHQGPYAQGHLGDLPVLYVTTDGKANTPTLAPRLKLEDIKGLAVMIHENGDNYSNTPPLGGGGGRIACGLLK